MPKTVSIDGLIGALDRAGDKFEFVQVRHEEIPAFMASGHAKCTGDPGVCIATSGPGAAKELIADLVPRND